MDLDGEQSSEEEELTFASDDDEGEQQEEFFSHSSSSKDSFEIIFRAASQLQTIVSAIGWFMKNGCTFMISKKGMCVRESDSGHVCFIEIVLKPSWFLSFQRANDINCGVSVAHMQSMLKKIPGSCTLTMKDAEWSDLQSAVSDSSSGVGGYNVPKFIGFDEQKENKDDGAAADEQGKAKTMVSGLCHFSYTDQYGGGVVHSQLLLDIEGQAMYPSFPEGEETVSTLRIDCGRMKKMVNRLRISDPDDKDAPERAVLNIVFQEERVTFACEDQGRIVSTMHVYSPEYVDRENARRREVIERIGTRKKRCQNTNKPFQLTKEEKMIMECPRVEVDSSVRIHNSKTKGAVRSTRLNMKYVIRALSNAPDLSPVVFIDVGYQGLSRIRYHLPNQQQRVGSKRKASAAPRRKPLAKRRRKKKEDEDDDDIFGTTNVYDDDKDVVEDTDSVDQETEDTAMTQSPYDYLDTEFGGEFKIWIAPRVDDDDDVEEEEKKEAKKTKKRKKKTSSAPPPDEDSDDEFDEMQRMHRQEFAD